MKKQKPKGKGVPTPSDKHFLEYDASTFENEGFKTLHGRISQLAMQPRYWCVTVKVLTENYDGTGQIKDEFNIKTKTRYMLSDLRDYIKKLVLDKDDYLPVCTQCLVTARVMM
jgi:hypothetical protein